MWPFGKKKAVEPENYVPVPKPDPKVGEFWLSATSMDHPFLQINDPTVVEITGVEDGFVQYRYLANGRILVGTLSYFRSWFVQSKYLKLNGAVQEKSS